MKVEDFIGDYVNYDEHGQLIFGNKNDSQQLLLDVRGWGAIQNLFDNFEDASKFQDELGKWFEDAINEKIKRSKEL